MPDYSDIIDLPHHTSKSHPPMSRLARAAQFAPFAALSGFGEQISEVERQFYAQPLEDITYLPDDDNPI